jgi:hypothetical protein
LPGLTQAINTVDGGGAVDGDEAFTGCESLDGGGAVSAVGTINAEQARENKLAITPRRPNLMCMLFSFRG